MASWPSPAGKGTPMSDDARIEIYDFLADTLTLQYGCRDGQVNACKLKIIDNKTQGILHQERRDVAQGQRVWTSFGYCQRWIYDAVTVMFEVEGTTLLAQQYVINTTPPPHPFVDFCCEQDVELSSYYEVFGEQVYARHGVAVAEHDVVVDIGSNQGAFIKYALEHNAATILSCEPNPYCLDTIHKYYGHHTNLTLQAYAIAATNGTTLLQIGRNSDTTGGGKIVEADANAPEYYVQGKTLAVATITFKHFLQHNQIVSIDFLKVDCEGSEVFIFVDENAAFFRTQVHKIALEFHNARKDAIITFVREMGYAVHVEYGEQHMGMLYAINPHFTKGMVASPGGQAP